MLALVVRYVAKDGEADAVASGLEQMAATVREREPDCLSFQVGRTRDNPNEFHLYEVYRDQAAFDAHSQTDYFKEIIVAGVRTHIAEREAWTCDVIA